MRKALRVAGLVMLAIACCAGTPVVAQTAVFSSSTWTLGSGFSLPAGIAVDASGNVYVTDYDNNLVKEIVAVNGGVSAASTVITLAQNTGNFSNPAGLAVDASGNVYVADSGNNAVKEIVAVNGAVSATSTVITLAHPSSGFNYPQGVAVDASGNVYVADTSNGVIEEIVAVNGAVSATSSVVQVGGVFGYPAGVAVDSSKNVYVADASHRAVVEMLASSSYGSSNMLGVTNGNFSAPSGIAVDGSRNVYIADSFNSTVKEIVAAGGYTTVNTLGSGFSGPSGVAVSSSGIVYVADTDNGAVKEYSTQGVNFGGAAVGTTTKLTLNFTFNTAGTIKAPAVLTQGAAGLDFTDAGTGSCTTNGASYSYSAGNTCQVDVNFTPKLSGPRHGAVELLNSSGAVIATGYVYGTGTGPQLTFSPATQSTLTVPNGSFTTPFDVAVDASGDVFVADYSGNTVKEVVAVGGVIPASPTVNTLGSGFHSPSGVAVDGAGNLFVADYGNHLVKEILAAGGYTTVNTLGSGFHFPARVAVDGAGNLFVADYGNNSVKEILAAGGYTTVNTLAQANGNFDTPVGVAVDGNGNVFVADANNSVVKEILAAGGYTTVNTLAQANGNFNLPYGVAVDGAGNVFVADYGSNLVKEIVAAGGYTTVNTLGSGFSSPAGVSVDGNGNVFVANFGTSAVSRLDYADAPSLTFATSTNVGSTDSTDGPKTVTLSNIGNVALSFLVPTTGNNPSIAANFTLDSSSNGTCPLTTSSGSAGTLAAGESCTLPVTFAPLLTGSLSGSLVLTDNNLNASPSTTQSIALSGTGVVSLEDFSVTGLSNVAAGTAQTITVTALDTSGNTLTDYTGTVHFTSSDSNAVLPANATLTNGVGTFSVTLKTAGSQTVAVSDTVMTSATGMGTATVTAAAASAITATAGSAQSAAIGAAFSSPLAVKVVDTYGNVVSGATVVFTAPASGASATFTTAAATSTSGTTSVTATANGTASSTAYTVTASVSGAATPASFSLTNTKASTSVTTTPSATALLYGQPVTLNAAVTPSSVAGSTPTGTVTFYDGSNPTSSALTLSGAAASYTDPVLSVGSHTFGAQYAGDANFAGSMLVTAASPVVVSQAASTLTPSVTSKTLAYGAGATITVNVAGQFSGAGISQPAGSISYTIGSGAAQTATILNGAATITVPTTQAVGTVSIVVNYAGNLNYTAATAASISLTVNQITPTVSWTQPSTISYGTTLASILNAAAAYNATPVTGSFVYTATPAGGAASVVNAGTVLPAGSYTLTASFTPTDTTMYMPAAGTVTLTVSQITPTVTLTASANSVTPQSPVTLTATVASTTSTPTGTVSIMDGTTLLSSVSLTNGVAALTTSALAVGTHSITAVYSGDTNFVTGTSTAISLTVNQNTPTVSWTQPSTISYGTTLASILNATAAYSATPVTGSFVYTATPAGGTALVVNAGTVLPAGSYTLTASFTPTNTTTYKSATGTVTLQVSQTAPVVTLSSSANPILVLNPVTLTATVASTVSAPSGTVSFVDGTTPLGTVALTNGVATLATSALAVGTHSITAVYSGDGNFLTGTSSAVSESVQDFSLSLTNSTGSTTSLSAPPGGTAVYNLTLAPTTGTTFPGPVTLSVTGLPPGATATFAPAVLPAGSSLANTVMTVQLPSMTAMAQPAGRPGLGNGLGNGQAPVVLGLLLLPFSGRLRRMSRKLGRATSLALLLLAGLGAMAGLTGCGSSLPPAKTYTLTITGTSGALSHSTTVSLTVE